jgi:hypothetical protein
MGITIQICIPRGSKEKNVVMVTTIFNGLSSYFKESIGQCTSTKDLWMKLEKAYQDKIQDIEKNPIKDMKQINEGKDPPKYSNFNDSKCNDVECYPPNKEEVCVESANNYLIDEEEDLLKPKDKVIDDLKEVSMETKYDSYDFEDIERSTKESLEKYQRYTMALRQILKKQEETTEQVISKKSNQLEEKEEEIKRLKIDIISQAE